MILQSTLCPEPLELFWVDATARTPKGWWEFGNIKRQTPLYSLPPPPVVSGHSVLLELTRYVMATMNPTRGFIYSHAF